MTALIILAVIALAILSLPIVRQPYRIALLSRVNVAGGYVCLIPRFKQATYVNSVLDMPYAYEDDDALIEALVKVKNGRKQLLRARRLARR